MMLTGRRFWTFAMVLALCVIVTAGCKRRKSKGSTTITNGSDIFTTDSFPGAPVQSGNVSDDKRALSNSSENYQDNSLRCTHNGIRGTAMVTFETNTGLYATYYDGAWTPPVLLHGVDIDVNTAFGDGGVVHAFINTEGHADEDATDRDGDCLIFWIADDFDDNPTAAADEANTCLWMTYFDVSKRGSAAENHGFDVDPSDPGIFYAQRVNGAYDDASEDVTTLALVTDGLCGEARWEDGDYSYRYGDATEAIAICWHQIDEKSGGFFDDTTAFNFFDLGLVIDEEFPLVPSAGTELALFATGVSDGGVTCLETIVSDEYVSYNAHLFRRVQSQAAGATGFFDTNSTGGGDGEDTSIFSSFFDLDAFTILHDCINTVDPSSGVADTVEMNSNFCRPNNFIDPDGTFVYGSDEGLSCVVTYFVEIVDGDLIGSLGTITYNVSLCIAELDEVTGGFLNDAEDQFVDGEDSDDFDDADEFDVTAEISRNGDYIWIAWLEPDDAGAFDDDAVWACQFLTTRLDEDGLPTAIPALTTTLGGPILTSVDQDGIGVNWFHFQDNLGYICGHQSDAAEMNVFYCIRNPGFTDDFIHMVTLDADVDGTIGSESFFNTLLITEDDDDYHFFTDSGVNGSRRTFNATDAGQDGDIFFVFGAENSANNMTDNHLFAQRVGLLSAGPIQIDSGRVERQVQYSSEYLTLIATPPGSSTGQFDRVDDFIYDDGAHFGPGQIHLFFREAESMTAWQSFGGTNTGRALRTRVYNTETSAPTFGEDFTPTAGGGALFLLPFDLDVPFVDVSTSDDVNDIQFAVCDDKVGVWYWELGHIYYQEFGGGVDNEIGWRTLEGATGDPALVDDDSDNETDDNDIEDFCVVECGCCDLNGAMVFWEKEIDDDSGAERLQVRVRE